MSHPCPATDCPLLVGDHLLMCARHWRLVPADIQAEVWRSYRARGAGMAQRIAHADACLRAIEAVNKSS